MTAVQAPARALGSARTAAVVGLRALPVVVEAHIAPGLPGFHVIGVAGAASAQAADRVRAALGAIGVSLPNRKVLLSLAPADTPKVGARFDLAMAAAVLSALGVLAPEALEGTALLGELALDAACRSVPGVLPSAAALPAQGLRRIVVAEADAPEAALTPGVEVVGVADLAEAVAVLRGDRPARPAPAPGVGAAERHAPPDLADVRGQPEARRALELAAAGGHHLLLIGPPGCGKSMLARRLPGILPPLSHAEALEVAAVRSVSGISPVGDGTGPVLDVVPPFQAPHHGTSAAALLGGGSGVARPGALSRAHRGVLFLDELLEWPRSLLDALREPLEEGVVRVARSKASVTYPARALLVGASNPCPCGGGERCTCTDEVVWRYRSKLSGPLADRIDLAPTVAPLSAADLLRTEPEESSAVVARRVAAARCEAAERWGEGTPNAEAPPELLRRTATPSALSALAAAVDAGALTGRGFDRTLRVARTIADLEGCDVVGRDHVLEARAHRLTLHTVPERP